MAVVNTKGVQVTNADASSQTLTNTRVAAGVVKEIADTLEAVSGDSIGSTYRLGRVRSSSRVSQLLLSCDAITTCAADFGLYDTAANGGAVISAACFASAQSLAAALANTDITHESGTLTGDVANVGKPLWQALGLTADPMKDYDIVATLTAAAGSAGTISLKTRYVDGN